MRRDANHSEIATQDGVVGIERERLGEMVARTAPLLLAEID